MKLANLLPGMGYGVPVTATPCKQGAAARGVRKVTTGGLRTTDFPGIFPPVWGPPKEKRGEPEGSPLETLMIGHVEEQI